MTALRKIAKVAEKEHAILEMSTLTGMSVTICADIISNYSQENDVPFIEAARRLKKTIKKDKKSRGRRGKY